MKLKNFIAPLIFGVCVVLSNSHAVAADSVVRPAATPAQFGELDELRAQNAILTLQLQNKELRDKLGAGAEAGPRVLRAPQAGAVPSAPVALPKIQLISGVGAKLSATLQLSDGRHVNVVVGSVVPNAGVVRQISKDEVVVLQKGQLVSLPFAAETGQASLPSPSSIMPPLPPELMSSGAK